MIAISFKTHGTNGLYNFFIKFQCNQNDTCRVNKNYILVAATISSVKRDVVQNYGAGACWYEICMAAYSK